eukprot:48738-Eustigmatos_ZCMA.PRE.1
MNLTRYAAEHVDRHRQAYYDASKVHLPGLGGCITSVSYTQLSGLRFADCLRREAKRNPEHAEQILSESLR